MRHLLATTTAGALMVAAIFTANALASSQTTPAVSADHTNHATHQPEQEGAAATIGDLAITSAWARATLPGQKSAGAYLIVTNHGTTADRLTGVASPSADKTEIHTMEVIKDVMTMRPVEGGLEIPAGGSVELKPGGYHIMFMGISEPFADGASVPVTLHFATAGEVELALPVRLVRGQGQGHNHDNHQQQHKN